jgi:hypothetical protein
MRLFYHFRHAVYPIIGMQKGTRKIKGVGIRLGLWVNKSPIEKFNAIVTLTVQFGEQEVKIIRQARNFSA